MKKNIIISNLFNNLNLPNEMTAPWELQYQNLAEKCQADFCNFKSAGNGEISKNYIEMISHYFKKQFDKKVNQLSSLDQISECFANGYEWVFAMDADICINPNTDFTIEECKKEVVYFSSVSEKLAGKRKFASNLKDSFLKETPLIYGNQGVLLISNIVWNSIKEIILDYKEITKYSKPENIKGFFSHIDQNILSIGLTLKNIEVSKIPKKPGLFLHLIAENIQRYRDTYNISDQYFDTLQNKYFNSIDSEISKRHMRWLPLLFHYLDLPQNEKLKLFT